MNGMGQRRRRGARRPHAAGFAWCRSARFRWSGDQSPAGTITLSLNRSAAFIIMVGLLRRRRKWYAARYPYGSSTASDVSRVTRSCARSFRVDPCGLRLVSPVGSQQLTGMHV